MAQTPSGILGPVEGTVGTVTGASWKGIQYIRIRSRKRKGGSSAKQIDVQLRFSLIQNFLQTMAGLIKLTFKKYAVEMTELNAAMSYNFHNAITGKSPDYRMDFSKALVSRGELPNATAPAATVTGSVIHFTWTDNSGDGDALPTDKAVLVAFSPNFNQTIYSAASFVRSSAAGTLDCTAFAGFPVETWIAFIAEDGLEASNSLFTGELSL